MFANGQRTERPGMMASFKLLFFTSCHVVNGDMLDILHKTMLAPAECKHGCASWATRPSHFWANSSILAEAGMACAQPAKAADSATLGAWCFCANSTAPLATRVDPDHPLDGKTKILFNTFGGENKWVSFAFTATPPGETGAKHWLRATYTESSDAMPVRFSAVADQKDAYKLYNTWKGYEGYLCAVRESGGDYMFLHTSCNESAALVLEVYQSSPGPGAKPGYIIKDLRDSYISFCSSGCSGGRWLADSYMSVTDAMTVDLLEPGSPPPSPGPSPPAGWGYCTYANYIPEQLNLQVCPLRVLPRTPPPSMAFANRL